MKTRIVPFILALSVCAHALVAGAQEKVSRAAGARRTGDRQTKWINPPKKTPKGVAHGTFHSKSMNRDVGFNIYTPPGYPEGDKRYPVIYWLHGLGGNESGSIRFARLLDKAIEEKKVPPMLMVFVNGGRASMYCDSIDKKTMAETAIVKELNPHVDKNYRTIGNRRGRAIQGMSMGGFGAIRLACKYPEVFSSVVSYGAALHNVDTLSSRRESIFENMFAGDRNAFTANSPYELVRRNADRIRGKLKIQMIVGSKDQTIEHNKRFHTLLATLKIPHEFEIVDGVPHNLGRYFEEVGTSGFEFAARAFDLNGEGKRANAKKR